MPLYCEHFQQVFLKESVELNYLGGIDKFKVDYKWNKERDHEDGILISLSRMDNHYLIPKGLDYSVRLKRSEDFVVISRYEKNPLSWKVDWIKTNKIFIWHPNDDNLLIKRMDELSSLNFNDLETIYKETGEWLLKDIN